MRWLQLAVIGVLVVYAALDVWQRLANWGFEDVGAYWNAALRLRSGEPLYGGVTDPDSYRVFRYAPWFAAAWVPLTYLPREAAIGLWTAATGLASLALVAGLLRLRSAPGVALAAIVTPMLFSLVQVGNVQPLLLAGLAFGISRRGGPLWVALATSLKLVPLLYALVYLARRQWRRAALTVGLAALLTAPILLAPQGYITNPGASFSLWYYVSPLAWALAAGLGLAVAGLLAWRRSAYLWVALGVAVILAAPRGHQTYLTFLVVGLLGGKADRL